MSVAMRSVELGVFAAIVLLCATIGSALAEPPDDLVKVKLLADVTSVEPGKPFTIGVNFKMSPGWHIYWINPGDSGMATQVEFSLPAGI